MDRKTFFTDFEKALKAYNISDIESILEEYNDHFSFKLADGYSEEEIAARLGDPIELAEQYQPSEKPAQKNGSKAVIAIGLAFADLFVGMLFVVLFTCVAVLGVFTAACAACGICLILNLNIYSLLPFMPYLGAAVMGVAFLALAVLSGVGAYDCWRYAAALAKAFVRWNKRCLSAPDGKRQTLPLPTSPQFAPKTRRILRRLTVFSLLAFVFCFVLAFVILALMAGGFGFWHIWGWFVA